MTVNGQAAQMLAGNTFEAYVDVPTVPTTVPVVATDTSGNATTKNYQVTGTGTAATYSYDANGHLIQKVEGSDTWTYEWNAEHQLERVLKNAVEQARFAYDPLGRRVERVAAGTTTLWAHAGEDILRETVGGSVTKYVHGWGVDEPLAQEDGSGTMTYIHGDVLGSVLRLSDAAGGTVNSRRYNAFGNIEVGAVDGYSFTAREWDAAAGLAYYRARYYSPTIGRFVSQGPIGFHAGINFYAYVRNKPADQADPSGLWDWPTLPQDVRDDARQWQNPFDPPNWKNNWVPKVPSNLWDTQNRLRHCLASCLITRYVMGGAFTAWIGGDLIQDPYGAPWSDPGDRRANKIGRCVAKQEPNKSCEEACIDHYADMYQAGEPHPR